MKNKKEKKLKLMLVTMDKSDPQEFVIQIDDSISDEDLKSKEFRSFVKKRLVNEWYRGDIPKYVLRTVKLKEVSEDDVFETWIGVYKRKKGKFDTCVALDNANIESSLYLRDSVPNDSKGFTQVYLSCSLEKTKELWNKGKIEELKSYFIPDKIDCRNVEEFNKVYDSRNGRVRISIRNKNHIQKKYGWTQGKEGWCEVLVDNGEIPKTENYNPSDEQIEGMIASI